MRVCRDLPAGFMGIGSEKSVDVAVRDSYSFLWCLGTAVPTVFGVLPNVSCWDWGRMCQVWSGLFGMKSELGHSLTVYMFVNELLEHCELCQ